MGKLMGLGREEKRDEPAQFTSEEGEGRDLYACHSNEAAFDRLLFPFPFRYSIFFTYNLTKSRHIT